MSQGSLRQKIWGKVADFSEIQSGFFIAITLSNVA